MYGSKAKWYRRKGHKEDPWISLVDHKQAQSSDSMLYGEAGRTENAEILHEHYGANVYIRKLSELL